MNQTRRRTILAGVLIATSFLAQGSASRMSPAEIEAIAGYLGVLTRMEPEFKVLAVASTTATAEHAFLRVPTTEEIQKRSPKATRAVIEEFLRVISNPAELELPRSSGLALRVYLIPEARLTHLFEGRSSPQAWAEFRAAFPGAKGLARISRVGVDNDSGQALLFMSLTPGGLGGSGHLVLLERDGTEWHIVDDSITWVS